MYIYILDQISSENNGLCLFLFNPFLSTGFAILLGVEEVGFSGACLPGS